MKFKKHELFLTPLVLIAILCLSLFSVLAVIPFLNSLENFATVIVLFLFYFLFIFWTLLFLKGIRSLCPLTEGLFSMEKDTRLIMFWKLQGFLYIFNLGLFLNASLLPINLRSFFYSSLGANIGKCVMIGGKILEPSLVEVGEYSHLGEDSIVSAHGVAGQLLTLRKVKIGKNVTIGAGAIVSPGAKIGDGSVVAMGSVVSGKTNIPSNEIWGGIPAKKIGEV